jgi:hypothetical protein
MSRWSLLQIGLLGSAFALATVLFGWWGVPILAWFWGLYDKSENRPALIASAAAGLGWGFLLIWTATQGPVLGLSSRASGVLAVPSLTLILLTLMFPMILAWGAGVLGGTVRQFWKRQVHSG